MAYRNEPAEDDNSFGKMVCLTVVSSGGSGGPSWGLLICHDALNTLTYFSALGFR